MKKPIDGGIQGRITTVLLFFVMALVLLLGRIFILQIVHYKDYYALAAKQHQSIINSSPDRGTIFAQDRKGEEIPLALLHLQKNIAISPKAVLDPEKVASLLAETLGIPDEEIKIKLEKKDDPYEIVAKKITDEQAVTIQQADLSGVLLEEEKTRAYPYGMMASRLLGFVSTREQKEAGQYGLERSYDKDLSGSTGILAGFRDSSGFLIALGRRIISPSKKGSNLVLTIDYNIQQKSEEVLQKTAEKWQAPQGILLVMDPKTGKVLADASFPNFDPNDYGKEKDFSVFLNPAVELNYELGSVVKPITMAAGLEEGKVKPDTVYDDKGEVKIKGYTIKNFDLLAHGFQTMTQVLEKSLNTGVVYVSKLLGQEKQLEYLKRFGFGQKTNIDLPGEVTGDIAHLNAGREIDFATASFGQGIAITPLQLASAIGAIANGGKLMKPYVVEKVIDGSGNEVQNNPQEVRTVISQKTSETLTKMLVSAVRNGFDNHAGVKGYFIAGKTGTAQIPNKDGKGYSDNVIHTFVGFAPAFNPRFMVLMQLNEPKGNRFAANTLTPAFHDLAEYILNYYEIPPDETSASK